MTSSIRSLALVLGAAAFAAGCVSDEKLVSTTTVGTPLLARYVSMGNSITAGMQSAGINDSVQKQAYPVLLARMAGVPFTYPSFGPGCPALYTAPLNLNNTLTANIPGGCALRSSFQGLVNNVAVPGEFVADLTSATSPGAKNALTTFINGGLNETQAMKAVNPTFVSLWAPNNDILGAVNLGDTTAAVLTPLATYMAAFNAAVDQIKAANPQGVALIGVVDVPDFAPIVQPGAYFYAVANSGGPNPFGKPVDPSCSPFTATGQLNPFGFNLVSLQALGDPTVTTIKCTPDAKWVTTRDAAGAAGGTPELPVFEKRIADINTAIKAIATTNNWVYIDPNTDLGNVLADPSKFRKCQGFSTISSLATFQAAVVTTCPALSAPFFGSWVSFDGTHPTLAFHQAMASLLATKINTRYGTSITTTAPASGAVFAR